VIRKIIRFFRFATKAERLLLAYQAWGYGEDEVLERWRNDLEKSADTRYRDFQREGRPRMCPLLCVPSWASYLNEGEGT
jgi:hypothetical protein